MEQDLNVFENYPYPICLTTSELSQHLPVVYTHTTVQIREQFGLVLLSYFYLNNTGNNVTPNLYYKRPEKGRAIQLEIFRLKHGLDSFKEKPDRLEKFEELNKDGVVLNLTREMNANELLRVEFQYSVPLDCSKDGSLLNFTLPANVFQVVYGTKEFESFANCPNFNSGKFHKGDDCFLVPWDLNVNKVMTSLKRTKVEIRSSHQTAAKFHDEDVISLNSADFNHESINVKDFELSYGREFSNLEEPITLVEFDPETNNFYFYAKYFPYNVLKSKVSELSVQLDGDTVEGKNFFFTIIADFGGLMDVYSLPTAKETVCVLLDKLPENSNYRVVTLPRMKVQGCDFRNQEFLKNDPENVANSKNEIRNFKLGADDVDITDFGIYLEAFKEDWEVDESDLHRFIFVGKDVAQSETSIQTNCNTIIDTIGSTKFYYLSVVPQISLVLDDLFFLEGCGFADKIDDEFDIENKVEKLYAHTAIPFVYSVTLDCPELPEIIDDGKDYCIDRFFSRKSRNVDEPVEFFAEYNINDNSPPEAFTLILNFYFYDGNNGSSEGKFVFDQNKTSKDYHLQKFYKERKRFVKFCHDTGAKYHGAANIEGGKVIFDISYGSFQKSMSFPLDTVMDDVINMIKNEFKIKTYIPADWKFGGGKELGSGKKLKDYEKNDLDANIVIKEFVPPKSLDLHKQIVSKINSEQLLEFDPTFVVGSLEVSKENWNKLETAVLANKSKFKGNLDKIVKGTSRNLVFTLFCIYYLTRKFSKEQLDEIEDGLKKIKSKLKMAFDYTDALQQDFDALVSF